MADEITKDKKTPSEQAKALYDWVSDNITFAGNCIGVGSVVPRDTGFVLDNHMGDCKDYATLLQALLSAKKIPSTQALINSGRVFDRPKIPMPSMVNHVINYIPGLNIYADASAGNAPFGFLPDSEMGKPVLLVDGYKEGLKTPTIPHDSDKTMTRLKVKLREDGSASGSAELITQGRSAIFTNANMSKAISLDKGKYKSKERKEEFSKDMIKQYGFEGGKIDFNIDEYPKSPDISRMEYIFDVKKFMRLGSAGAFYISPVFMRSYIYSSVKTSNVMEESKENFTCGGAHYEEEYIYEFPKKIKILATPDNFSYKNELVSYQASYVLKDNVLTVNRKYDDLTQGPVCEPKISKFYKELADKAMPNLDSQVVYK